MSKLWRRAPSFLPKWSSVPQKIEAKLAASSLALALLAAESAKLATTIATLIISIQMLAVRLSIRFKPGDGGPHARSLVLQRREPPSWWAAPSLLTSRAGEKGITIDWWRNTSTIFEADHGWKRFGSASHVPRAAKKHPRNNDIKTNTVVVIVVVAIATSETEKDYRLAD